jgi:uncharacterized tellurite resistance protein B-like protein
MSTPPPSSIIDQEMDAIIYYLTAFAHIDGSYDAAEKLYIAQFIDKLVSYRTRLAMKNAGAAQRDAEVARWQAHFQHVFARIEQQIAGLLTESVADGENSGEFVFAKLKLRCYELFRRFPEDDQRKLLVLADELMQADGQVHPHEAKFRSELEELLATEVDLGDEELSQIMPAGVLMGAPTSPQTRVADYDLFQAFERHFPSTKEEFARDIEHDIATIERTIAQLGQQRQAGKGRLAGVQDVRELEGAFLDGYVHCLAPTPGKEYELIVLGDLHGCYSCLKAALLQTDFFAKVDAHHLDPSKPEVKLVLLGDYIDRGRYSYNGVLRAALQLFLLAPEHVYILRGNHEFYVELNGRVYGGVKPAEALESLQNVADPSIFKVYKRLFESLPNMLLFGRTLFVHAGIPRDDTLALKWQGLATLNDPEIRFQMLWSDPSEADYIPLDLQKASARFPFGKRQFKSFLSRLGCNLMIRGHERVVEGLKTNYGDADAALLTLFSAGGERNRDLPETSNYREVKPAALIIKHRDGVSYVSPFQIDWERYNQPEVNGFFRS